MGYQSCVDYINTQNQSQLVSTMNEEDGLKRDFYHNYDSVFAANI
jgi:hypothetical protein